MHFALDTAGAEHSPNAQVKGAIAALKKSPDLMLTLFGFTEHRKRIEKLLRRARSSVRDRIGDVIYSSTVSPAHGTKKELYQKGTTLDEAVVYVHEGKADAIFTSGSTGSLVGLSHSHFGKIRPGLSVSLMGQLLSDDGHDVIMLDIGARPEIPVKDMQMYATVGTLASKILHRNDNPAVRLLNIGTEDYKGNAFVREAATKLKEQGDIRFEGYAEPKHVSAGAERIKLPLSDNDEEPQFETRRIDVVVSNGYDGNMFLKGFEAGASSAASRTKKKVLGRPWYTPKGFIQRVAGLVLRPVSEGVREEFKATIGGAMVLGVNGLSFKFHGSSDKHDVEHLMLGTAAKLEKYQEFLQALKKQ